MEMGYEPWPFKEEEEEEEEEKKKSHADIRYQGCSRTRSSCFRTFTKRMVFISVAGKQPNRTLQKDVDR